MNSEMITTKTAAAEWGCTRRTIERYIKSGKLKAFTDGHRYKILRTDWDTFKARHLVNVA